MAFTVAGGKVMAVDNEAGEDRICRQQLPMTLGWRGSICAHPLQMRVRSALRRPHR
jgi:hypothetical protein